METLKRSTAMRPTSSKRGTSPGKRAGTKPHNVYTLSDSGGHGLNQINQTNIQIGQSFSDHVITGRIDSAHAM